MPRFALTAPLALVLVPGIALGAPGIIVTPDQDIEITEAGTFDLQVVLAEQPVNDVVVGIEPNSANSGYGDTNPGPDVYIKTPSPVTFTVDNWDVPQTLSIGSVDDTTAGPAPILEGPAEWTIQARVFGGGDDAYKALPPVLITGTTFDDDVAGFVLDYPYGQSPMENAGNHRVRVKTLAAPEGFIHFRVFTDDASEATPNHYTDYFYMGQYNWSSGVELTLDIPNDPLYDGDKEVNFTVEVVSPDPLWADVESVDGSITVVDDETVQVIATATDLPLAEGSGLGEVHLQLQASQYGYAETELVLNPVSSDDSEGICPDDIFTFEDGGELSFKVIAPDDEIDDGDQTWTVNFSNRTEDLSEREPDPYNLVFNGGFDDKVAGWTLNSAPFDSFPDGVFEQDGDTEIWLEQNIVTEPGCDYQVDVDVLQNGGVLPGSAFNAVQYAIELYATPVGAQFYSFNQRVRLVTDEPRTFRFSATEALTRLAFRFNGHITDSPWIIDDVSFQLVGCGSRWHEVTVDPVSFVTVDDDDSGVSITEIGEADIGESGGFRYLLFRLESEPVAPVIWDLTVSNFNGFADIGTVVLDADNWDVGVIVMVGAEDDSLVDGTQPFEISATSQSDDELYDGIDAGPWLYTAEDNDSAELIVKTVDAESSEDGDSATVTVQLSAEPSATVTIFGVVSDPNEGSTVASVTIEPGDWDSPQTFVVTGLDDDEIDGDQTYALFLTSDSEDPAFADFDTQALLFNVENDVAGLVYGTVSGAATEGGGAITVPVSLTARPTADVTVTFVSGDEGEGTVTTTLTFTPETWDVPQDLVITGVDDVDVDGAQTLSIQPSFGSTDLVWDDAPIDAYETVNQDNDDLPPLVTPKLVVTSVGTLETEESGTVATFTVALSEAVTSPVALAVTSTDPTEAIVATPLLVFTAADGTNGKVVTIIGADDALVDGDQPFAIDVTASWGVDGLEEPVSLSGLNHDDDVVGLWVSNSSGLVTTEKGGDSTFEVALSARPTAEVTVAVTAVDPDEATPSPATLTFTADNWAFPQIVTATGADDEIDDGEQAFELSLALSSTEGGWSALPTSGIVGINIDDDTAGVVLGAPSEGAIQVDETGTNATITVVLSSEPEGAVSVALSSGDATEGAVSPGLVAFDATNWDVPQNVTISGVDDDELDGAQPFVISVSTQGSADAVYAGLNPDEIIATNLDDESQDDGSDGGDEPGECGCSQSGGSAGGTWVIGLALLLGMRVRRGR